MQLHVFHVGSPAHVLQESNGQPHWHTSLEQHLKPCLGVCFLFLVMLVAAVADVSSEVVADIEVFILLLLLCSPQDLLLLT